MATLDVIFLSAIAGFMLLGALSGFIHQLVTPAALVLAALFGYLLAAPLGTAMVGWFDDENLAPLAAGFLASAATFLIARVGLGFLEKFLTANATLKIGDRVAGAALGAIKGAVLGAAAVLLLVYAGKAELRESAWCAEPLSASYEKFTASEFYQTHETALRETWQRQTADPTWSERLREKITDFGTGAEGLGGKIGEKFGAAGSKIKETFRRENPDVKN